MYFLSKELFPFWHLKHLFLLLFEILIGGRDREHASVEIYLFFLMLRLRVLLLKPSKRDSINMPSSVSEYSYFLLCVYLYVCFLIYFAGGKTSYFSSITSFEKFSDQNPMKLRQTNVYLWKSARTVLHLIYRFCSKGANQIGNTSSLLNHCLKQYPIINCTSNG